MKCKKCGADNNDNVRYCSSCGERVAEQKPLESKTMKMPADVNPQVTKKDFDFKMQSAPTSKSVVSEVQKSRVEQPKAEQPNAEQPRAKKPMVETPKVEQPRVGRPSETRMSRPTVPPLAPTVNNKPVQRPSEVVVQESKPTEKRVESKPVQTRKPEKQLKKTKQNIEKKSKKRAYDPLDETTKPMGFFGWVWSLIVMHIPIVGFIFILVWSFSERTNRSKKSFAQVVLVFQIICIILFIVGMFNLFNYVGGVEQLVNVMIEDAVEFMKSLK